MPDFTAYTRQELDITQKEIEKAIYTIIAGLKITAWLTIEPVPYSQRKIGKKLDLKVGDRWGGLFDSAWFHFTGEIPSSAKGQPVVLLLDVNGEMLVVDQAGAPQRGLTNVASTYDYSLGLPGKRVLPITSQAQGGEIIDVWADAGANDLFGNLSQNGVIREASIAICHENVRSLYYDFEFLLDFLKVLPPDSVRFAQILRALNDARWALASGYTDETVCQARQPLKAMLDKRGGDASLVISAAGHAHIDLAWLWPLRESKRKLARTYATVLANMEKYPDYIFGASQPQLFQWMKESYPALYERVRQRVQEGRFEPQGAMWVEADTNLSGGEALVRQLLLGKRFFQQEFGVDMHYLWLPDVFGYSAALPQILRKAGVDFFMTQKLSWNQINRFPLYSFHWTGIDGTRILAHMLPEETYNSPAAPRSVVKIEKNYAQKDISDHCLMLFGIGDGGGGPGEEHLERLSRLKNLAGLSPVIQEPARNFFEQWKKDASRFPEWSGELYLERHAGTLTTEAKNKWYNRRMEQSLRQLEWMALFAHAPYPAEQLEAIWREVLLYQFHDILPGSSIKRVYDECLARYASLYEEVQGLTAGYEKDLAGQVDTSGMQAPVVVFNSLSWERSEWVQANGKWKQVSIPPMGYRAVDMAQVEPVPAGTATPTHLENDRLSVTFHEDGSILSVYDKEAGREALEPGQRANRFAIYRDTGDAWDFSLDYAAQQPAYMQLTSSKARLDGPRAVVEQVYDYVHSELVQEISLTAGERRLDFNTRLRWREPHTMLRTSFAVAIHAGEAAYDIQFGHLRRPVHRNTTWDLAKDETAAQKWADLSQRDYGVALLNDSKYGYKIKNNIIDLNLLRSVPYPGPVLVIDEDIAPGEPHFGYTDQTDHVFRYALYPHSGDAVSGGVIQAGYAFNIPLRPVGVSPQPGSRPVEASFLTIDAPGVVVEAIKQAEDDNSLIVRLYESANSSVQATVHFGFPIQNAAEANLMEISLQVLDVEQDAVKLSFSPFEIKTLKVVPALNAGSLA